MYSFTRYAIAAAPGNDPVTGRSLKLETLLSKNFIFYLLGLSFFLGLIMLVIHLNAWNFAKDDNGIPHNWPPAAVSFLAFVFSIYLYFKFSQQQKRDIYLLLALNGLLLSVYFGSNIYAYHTGAFGKLKYAMIAVTFITGLWSIIKLKRLFTKFLLTGWVVLMGASVFSSRFYPAAFGYVAVVLLILALFLHYQYKCRKNAVNA